MNKVKSLKIENESLTAGHPVQSFQQRERPRSRNDMGDGRQLNRSRSRMDMGEERHLNVNDSKHELKLGTAHQRSHHRSHSANPTLMNPEKKKALSAKEGIAKLLKEQFQVVFQMDDFLLIYKIYFRFSVAMETEKGMEDISHSVNRING